MPMNSYSVRLKQVVEEFNLIVARESSDYDRIDLMVEEVMRPGLPLAGFFTHFEPLRLQVIGNAEATYLHSLTPERRAETFDQLFSYHIPALVFARNIEPMPECMQMAEKHDITILRCLESTSYVVSSLITYLKNALAPRITRHGVFVEVYGEGLLLMGESGIGKSEAAAELLKRGHRLIADDAVEIRKVAGNTLRGTSPELIRNYIEIPGIGYHIDKPLLYYSAKLARARGCDLLAVQYPALPTGLRGHAEKIEQAVQTALSAAEEQLTTIDWTAYDRVFFLSKSIGTAIAARYAVQHNIHPRQVYYTPIEQALPYLDPTGIAFHGTADPWANTEMITNGCRKIGIPLYLTENANHSMETGDTLHDIFILHDIMDETAHWMDSTT